MPQGRRLVNDPVAPELTRVSRDVLADLDDPAFERAVAGLRTQGLEELMTLVGYYRMLALQLRVFRVGIPT